MPTAIPFFPQCVYVWASVSRLLSIPIYKFGALKLKEGVRRKEKGHEKWEWLKAVVGNTVFYNDIWVLHSQLHTCIWSKYQLFSFNFNKNWTVPVPSICIQTDLLWLSEGTIVKSHVSVAVWHLSDMAIYPHLSAEGCSFCLLVSALCEHYRSKIYKGTFP